MTHSGRQTVLPLLRGAGPVDPDRVSALGFLLSDKSPGPFRLEVAWIDVIRNVQPTSSPN
jgi:hypothetical protein